MSTKKMRDGSNSIIWILQKSPAIENNNEIEVKNSRHESNIFVLSKHWICLESLPENGMGLSVRWWKDLVYTVQCNLQIGIAETMKAFP